MGDDLAILGQPGTNRHLRILARGAYKDVLVTGEGELDGPPAREFRQNRRVRLGACIELAAETAARRLCRHPHIAGPAAQKLRHPVTRVEHILVAGVDQIAAIAIGRDAGFGLQIGMVLPSKITGLFDDPVGFRKGRFDIAIAKHPSDRQVALLVEYQPGRVSWDFSFSCTARAPSAVAASMSPMGAISSISSTMAARAARACSSVSAANAAIGSPS